MIKVDTLIVEKLNSISNSLLKVKSGISGEALISLLQGELKVYQPHSVLYDLLKYKIIKEEKGAKDISKYTFSIVEKNARDLNLLEQALQNYIYVSSGVADKLVWSYPKGMDFEKLTSFEQLYPELCSLISNAKESILILNPFFDSVGVERISPYLKAAIGKGIDVKIITGRHSNADEEGPLHDLISQIKNSKNQKIEVRNFYGTQGSVTYSIHAKLMIFDQKRAYLGSANLTQRSLSANIEMGVIISDSKIKALVGAFQKIWEASRY